MRRLHSAGSLLIITIVLIAITLLAARDLTGKSPAPQPPAQTTRPAPSFVASDQQEQHYQPAEATKFAACTVTNGLPDIACTPGAVLANATTAKICMSGYASSVRNVSEIVKRQSYLEYAVTDRGPNRYVIDHLISLELGGSNYLSNLWPQRVSDVYGPHQKDIVEDYLHDQLCSGKKSLQEVQRLIATDWVAAYKAMPKQ